MNKKILLTTLLLFFIFSSQSFAHIEDSIEFMDIQIELLENGDATIQENLTTNFLETPEFCRTMKDVNISMFEDLSILEVENNLYYTSVNDWNALSLLQKQNKFSLFEENNTVKLCFVGSEPGFHSYTIKYTVKSFVEKFSDEQGFHFDFLTDDVSPVTYETRIEIVNLKTSMKPVDTIIIGILTFVACLYVILESYLLIHDSKNKVNPS